MFLTQHQFGIYMVCVCVCVCVCVGGGEDKPPKSHISLDLHKLRERLHLMDNRGEGRTKSLQGRGQQRGGAEEGKGCGDYVSFPKSERQVLGFWERFSSLSVSLRRSVALCRSLSLSVSLCLLSLSLSISLMLSLSLSTHSHAGIWIKCWKIESQIAQVCVRVLSMCNVSALSLRVMCVCVCMCVCL